MERVTIRIPEQQLDSVEELVENGKFPNQSEAIRTAVREMLDDADEIDAVPAGRRQQIRETP